MRRRFFGLIAACVLASVAVPASAATPTRTEDPFTILFPDVEQQLVVLINTDRASYCTPAVVAWEEAFIAWLDGGEVGDPPADPAFPAGLDPISVQETETGQGAIVYRAMASGLTIELWEMDADAPLVGPCTDTDDSMTLVASGTSSFQGNDNDIFGSGTRGNAFGDRGSADLSDAAGNDYRYSWVFHINDRCYAPEDGPSACLIDRSKLQAH